jgi:CSLREA domain-containing protein
LRLRSATRRSTTSPHSRCLRFEPLEDRRLLSASPIVVTTLADTVDFSDGQTSLREAIFAANTVPGADTIEFAPSLTASGPARILLTQGELKIIDSLTITGPGADLLTIDASGNDPTPGVADGKGSRIFNIDDGNNANILATQISGLTLTGGDVKTAGAVLSRENLTLTNCTITGNISSPGAGGVYNKYGDLTVAGCTFTHNSGRSAVVYESGGKLRITDSAFANNFTGEGSIVTGSNATLSQVTISNNSGGSYSDNILASRSCAVTISGESSISDCDISGNQKLAGLLAVGGLANVRDSTISGNGGVGIAALGDAGTEIDIEHCAITDNRGTGIYTFRSGVVTIANCQISGNTLTPFVSTQKNPGGGIRTRSAGTVSITDCVVAENTGYGARYGVSSVGSAGGIHLGGTTIMATISGCTVTGNKTSSPDPRRGPGGGIAVLALAGPVPVSITGCQITGNSASSGAGIYVLGAGVTISDCSITGNQGTDVGGGIATTPYSASLTFQSAISVQNCTISGNTAARGGGISGDIVAIQGCTISDNSATMSDTQFYKYRNGNGGGIYANSLSATNCTITGNSASANGGGVFIATGTLTATNSILAQNTAALGPDISGYLGTTLDLHYSLVGNASGSGLAEAPVGAPDAKGNLIGGPVHGVIDPKIGPLVYNGGPVFLDGNKLLTQMPLPGRPAIDTGDPAAVAGMGDVPAFDQRGAPFSRVVGGRIDMGAVEFQPNPLPSDYNFDGTVNAADYTVWRDTLGSTTDLRADSSGPTVGTPNGIVDQADYDFWKSRYGNMLAGSGAASVATNTASSAIVESSDSAPLEAVFAPAQNGDSFQAVTRGSMTVSPSTAASGHDDSLLAWLAAQTVRPSHGDDSSNVHASQDLSSDDSRGASLATIDDAFAGLSAGGRDPDE